MKIAVLHASFEGSTVPFNGLDPRPDPARYLDGHHCTQYAVAKATAVRQVMDLARQGFDAVINLCDGAWDEDRAGIEVVQALERANLPFTGAGAAFYDPSREAMKMACRAAGVRFPNYVQARVPADVERAAETLRFPLIVKHPASYSSIGLTRDSRVTEFETLVREAQRMMDNYGAALIEEFIAGREFTVLVAEPRHADEIAWALAPVEFRFPDGESFKHFDLKWRDYRGMETVAVADAALACRLRDACAGVFTALGGTGYGRCDLRMDSRGGIYLLEINPNCAVFYPDGEFGSADFILANDPAGHRGFLDHLLTCALRRRDRGRPTAELRHHSDHGFALYAARYIATGELVERHADRIRMAVPGRTREWRPIDHSCDANLTLLDNDLIARRAIAAGQPLTVDYHELTSMHYEEFACHCHTPSCRGTIRPLDTL